MAGFKRRADLSAGTGAKRVKTISVPTSSKSTSKFADQTYAKKPTRTVKSPSKPDSDESLSSEIEAGEEGEEEQEDGTLKTNGHEVVHSQRAAAVNGGQCIRNPPLPPQKLK